SDLHTCNKKTKEGHREKTKGTKRVNRLRFLAHEGLLAQNWLLVPAMAGAAAALPLPAGPTAGGFDLGEPTVTNQMFGQPLSE
ncbi:MAG: hypothetical protein QFE16_01465, partial [Pseudomonadota bacterium]|nr:hypothetical protein [Pseudomonadota bacterium]